ncbi:MAG: endonuclease III [Candidatus Sumerlaeia bacterium]
MTGRRRFERAAERQAPRPSPLAEVADFPIDVVLARIRRAVRRMRRTTLNRFAGEPATTPFQILVSCIISLRTKDDVTAAAARRLFARADTPAAMIALGKEQAARLIYPAGFYNQKAGQIVALSKMLIERFGGRVPDTLEDLLTLKGVGRKTANLVLTIGFGKPGICVDTHVHRITNRWGYVNTRTPEQTEMALRTVLPRRYWIPINDLLVTWGQNVCTPLSPWCSRCEVADFCRRRGVKRSR